MSYIRVLTIERRARNLTETCKKLAINGDISKSDPFKDLGLNLIFVGEMGYCWNRKAASSSFDQLLARMTKTSASVLRYIGKNSGVNIGVNK